MQTHTGSAYDNSVIQWRIQGGGVQGVRTPDLLIRVAFLEKIYVQNMSLMQLQCQ